MSGDAPLLPAGIPRFNWAAFLLAPFWGLAHGQWAGVFFVPLWVFVDNMLRGPRPFGALTLVLGASMALVTLAFQVVYALNANRVAWARAAGRVEPEAFARRQRTWGMVAVALLVASVVAGIARLVSASG